MTTTPWAHLPNAVHIDRVIANVSPHCRAVGWDAAWWAARVLLIKQGRYPVWLESRAVAWNAAQDAVWDAVLALIAYDDCAYMLDSDPGELAILAKFGDPRAILLLPACKAFHSLKELV